MTAPVFSYKISTVGGMPAGGKADTTPDTGTAGSAPAKGTAQSSGADSYTGTLYKEGLKKQGKPAPAPETDSGDPVAGLLEILDQVSKQGVPDYSIPFAKISAESALAKFPDSPDDVLTKYNSILTILQKKIKDIETAMANGGGTPQQVAAAQQLKSQLEDLLSYYKLQRDKVAAYAVVKQKFWEKELQNFKETGGKFPPNHFDKDDDGWIGRPEVKGSYRIGIRTFDKKYTDPVAKKMVEVAKAKGDKLTLKYEFNKGDKQYWAVNPETNQRAQFDPITGKLTGEQVAAPGYTAKIGSGFGNSDGDVTVNAKGELELKTGKLSSKKYFAEAGLELHTIEYVWVETDADGEPVLDDNSAMKLYPFEMKDGSLVQKEPPKEGDTHYKQIYVKKMDVATESKDGTPGGDIVVTFRGGDNNVKILSLRITGGGKAKKASDTALAITSGDGASHRETPIIIDASEYQSTSRQGMSEEIFKKIYKDGSGVSADMNNAQIQDTFSHFKAGVTGEITSVLNRGISFKTQGHTTGTTDNDLFVQEEPPPYLGPDDPGYASVIEGQDGHNILLGKKGSVFANGMTLVDKESGDANDEISIGVNAFGEYKDEATGAIRSTKGQSKLPNGVPHSNALYIKVNAKNSEAVTIQSVPDGTDDKNFATNPNDPMAWDNNDYYEVRAKVIGTTAIDGNNPSQPFDPDLWKTGSRIPLQGKVIAASAADFSGAGKVFSERIKAVEEAVKKKTSDNTDFDWQIEGAKLDWMQGKYYQKDKNLLETFFADFGASKMKNVDPFKQLETGEAAATGGEK